MSANRLAATGFVLDQRIVAGLVAFCLGFAVLGTVGFAGAAEIHNAAHDTRHALGFPCH
jgi:cobalt transporter subunit CbtB